MTSLQLSVAVLGVFSYGLYVAGVWLFFRTVDASDSPKLKLLKWTALASKLFMIWCLFHPSHNSPSSSIVAFCLFLASLAIFFAAAKVNKKEPLSLVFSSDLPKHLVAVGPYRWVRHPFYTSYLLAYLAGVVGSLTPLACIPLVVMTAIYYVAAKDEEAKFESSKLASEYEQYRSQVGMFFPKSIPSKP